LELGSKGEGMEIRQLTLDEAVPVIAREPQKEFNLEKKICHGKPMRKVELSPGKYGYKCDECLTLMILNEHRRS